MVKTFFLSIVLLGCLTLTACSNKDEGNDVTGTQGGNNSPNTPSNPQPANGSTNVNRFGINLRWDGGDPNSGDTVRYDVFAGVTSNPNTLLSDDQLATSYYIAVLESQRKYYWKIVSKDNHGVTTDGPVWSFTTGN